MDVNSVTAAVTGIRFIKDALEVVLGYKIENESKAKINEALKQMGSVYETLYELRDELFRLQSENQELRQQLKTQEDLHNQRSQYRLEQTSGGTWVYVFIGETKHYACPVCFNKGEIQILQGQTSESFRGMFDCYNCRATYEIEPIHRNQRQYARGIGDPRGSQGWMS